MIEWGPQQARALKDISRWLADPHSLVYRLFGYAGTGKTTLAKHIAELARGPVIYGTFTGKAALVMQKNGCVGASTLHSLIYTVEEDEGEPHFVLNRNSPVASAGLIIVDEVSMVDNELGRDLMSFGRKVLVLGDPGQLPPIKGTGFFVDKEPDTMLTEIRRQALDNPIIYLSMRARNREPLQPGDYGDSSVRIRGALAAQEVLGADQVLIGRNATRKSYNARMRDLKGYVGDYPNVGERLICLRNNKEKGLINGGFWEWQGGGIEFAGPFPNGYVAGKVLSIDAPKPDPLSVLVATEFFDGDPKELPYPLRKQSDEFDYGYAITVHKSQGSQWPSVMVFDESRVFREMGHRWLYTAITRAEEKIDLII